MLPPSNQDTEPLQSEREWMVRHLNDAQRASGMGSWELDVPTGRVWCSQQLYRILGLPAGTIRTVDDFLVTRTPERAAVFKQALAEAIRTRTPVGYEAPSYSANGEERWLRGHGSLILDETGQVTRMICSVEDFTELKHAQEEIARKSEELKQANAALIEQNARLAAQGEELKRLDRLKDEFLSLLSHELRTPLTTIQGVLSLLSHLDPRQQASSLEGYHRRIGLAVCSLTSLVSDLLSAAQLQTGHFQLMQRPYAPSDVLNDVFEEVVPLAEFKGVHMHCDWRGSLPEMNGDRNRLIQVLRNLLLNAIRHTAQGGQVCLSAEADDAALRITVSDTGEGIAPGVRDRLFERFASLGAEDGVGLGLFVVKELVEAHGGHITVESEREAGTTFVIALPR